MQTIKIMNSLFKTPLIAIALAIGFSGICHAQIDVLDVREGTGIPLEVRTIYQKGTDFLASSQKEDGSWDHSTPTTANGVCGLCIMAFLSTGEDPNFGKYARNIRKSLQHIIRNQDPNTGYIGGNMYSHGFAMLALTEAYGAVDDEQLWAGEEEGKQTRSIGEALELAVRLAVTSQKTNSFNAWRYSPTQKDADTSVCGAVLMGLYGARNAGIEVPDETIDKALGYMRSMTSDSGEVGYSGMSGLGRSDARSSIACLVYAIGKHTDWKEYTAVKKFVGTNLSAKANTSWPFYQRYYQAQALFQSDYELWEKWNEDTIRLIRNEQLEDGSIKGRSHGPAYSTSMSLLALALNYRFLPIYER